MPPKGLTCGAAIARARPGACRGRGFAQILAQGGRELGGILGIARAGVRGFPCGRGGERLLGFLFAAEEILVFEKPSLAERVDQVLLKPADIQIARQANQMLAQIERAVRAVKIGQAFHQHGRNNQRRVGKMERIADQQAGLIRNRATA